MALFSQRRARTDNDNDDDDDDDGVYQTVDLYLFNTSFYWFLLICSSFILRTKDIVCVVYLLFRLANHKKPSKQWRLQITFDSLLLNTCVQRHRACDVD